MKARRNPKFLDELSAEELERSTSVEEVLWAVREYMNTGGHMGSLKEIRNWLKEEKHIVIKPWKLRNCLFGKMKLRYKRIEATSW